MNKIITVDKNFNMYKSLQINPNHIFGIIKIGCITRYENAYSFRQIQEQQNQF